MANIKSVDFVFYNVYNYYGILYAFNNAKTGVIDLAVLIKTNRWPKHELLIANSLLGSTCCLSQTNKCIHSVLKGEISNYNLILLYNDCFDCFIALNAQIQSFIHHSKSNTINIAKNPLELFKVSESISNNDIACIYLKHNSNADIAKQYYEKIVVFKKDALIDFCEFYEDYLFPNENDAGFCSPALFCSNDNRPKYYEHFDDRYKNDYTTRQYDLITKPRRNPYFRKMVLTRYNFTCVICGCTEPTILEAAHIIAVNIGGCDNADNGICLCRNHHRLFDSGKLEIDFKEKKFKLLSEQEQHAAWYNESKEKGCNLILPKEANDK